LRAAQAEFLSTAPPIHEHEDSGLFPTPDLIDKPESVQVPILEPNPQEIKTESGPIKIPDNSQVSGFGWPAFLGSSFANLKHSIIEQIISPPDKNQVNALEADVKLEPQVDSNGQDFNSFPPPEDDAIKSSEEIFIEIGRQLRNRREMLSLTYEEIERHTHVRALFLKALEDGALEDLPSPVQTRGILANYAGFLDLDADTILFRFADGLQARHREKKPDQPSRTRAPMTVHTSLPPLRSFIASDLLFGGGMAIMLLLFAIWGIGHVMTVRSTINPQATSPSISDVLAGTAFPTLPQEVTLIPAQGTSQETTPEATQTFILVTLGPDVNVQVNVTSIQQTFMRVIVDGKVQFDGRTVPGSVYPFQAKDQIEILVGSAAGLRVIYNGRDLGLMGNFGEVIDRVYTSKGVVTPTSTQAPTLTATPNISATPTQTSTSTPSVTPSPKPGE
jgi:cytoskeletal protein RodZ